MDAQPTTAPAPPGFNGWAAYGWLWACAITRVMHERLVEKDAEIVRLRTDNEALRDRLLLQKSVTPITPEMQTRGHSNGNGTTTVERRFKAPISSHIAEARKIEEAEFAQQRAAEAEKREAIRRDAEG
jgi:hypothetical protein